MSEEIPLKPMGKEDISKLEAALIFGTFMREDVLEKIRTAEDRLTWLDSLVVAAGALARERAGYNVSKIAEELARTESSIRNHLSGKSEAGKIIKETFEMLKKSGKLEIPLSTKAESGKIKEYEEKLNELNMQIEDIKKTISKTSSELKKIIEELEKIQK
ncbi:MAG: transcriptional regulator [Thermoproteota archaeon]|nr:transcriptional regulator [Candidatus Brockarchaeota archaeon]